MSSSYANRFSSLLTGPLGEARYEKAPSIDLDEELNRDSDAKRYDRFYKIPLFELTRVISTEEDDVRYRLPEDAYQQTRSLLKSQGLPYKHIKKVPSDSWYSVLASDVKAILFLIIEWYQLVSFSFLLNLPWITGILLTSGLPGLPGADLPSLSYSIPPVKIMVDLREYVFKWGVFEYYDYELPSIGAYTLWVVCSALLPFIAAMLFNVYFASDRFFFKKQFMRHVFNTIAAWMAGPLYFPAARALVSPFSCVTGVTEGGTYGRWIEMSLKLKDPYSCDSTAYPFLVGGCCVAFLVLFLLSLMLNLLDKSLQRPSTRYNKRLFVNGRAAMLPLCLLLIAKTGYVIAHVLIKHVSMESIAWTQSSLAILIALGIWLYPMYFKRTAAFLYGAFLGSNAYVAIVTSMHASGHLGLDDPDYASKVLLYGFGGAWILSGILAILGYRAWGMQNYGPGSKYPAGSFPPAFPFGIGRSLDLFGQGDLPLDQRETCSLGGSVMKVTASMASGNVDWRDMQTKKVPPPDPMSMTEGRPLYIVAGCCMKSEEGEHRACNRLRVGHILHWIFCFPIAFRDCCKNAMLRSSNPPLPTKEPAPGEPVKVRMALWWIFCFPFALYSARSDMNPKERPPLIVDVLKWLLHPISSFNSDFAARKAEFEEKGAPDIDVGPFFTLERVKNFAYWLLCCPSAWSASYSRRYTRVQREWFLREGRTGEAPEIVPAKRTPNVAREAAYNIACLPCAIYHRRTHYGDPMWPEGWSFIREAIFWIILPPYMVMSWFSVVVSDFISGREYAGSPSDEPFYIRWIAFCRGNSSALPKKTPKPTRIKVSGFKIGKLGRGAAKAVDIADDAEFEYGRGCIPWLAQRFPSIDRAYKKARRRARERAEQGARASNWLTGCFDRCRKGAAASRQYVKKNAPDNETEMV